MIEDSRIKVLSARVGRAGHHVLYWMQASQPAYDNHALEYSILEANQRNLPVIVFFGLSPDYPEANQRHYQFMLEGLQETERLCRWKPPWITKPIQPLCSAANSMLMHTPLESPAWRLSMR